MLSIQDISEHKIILKHLEIKNFKGFTQTEMSFNEDMTLLIADNGGGKTSILDVTSIFMSYFLTKGIKGKKEFKSALKTKDVKNGTTTASCKMTLQLNYKYPHTDLFNALKSVANYLNEYELEGAKAELFFQDTSSEDDTWVLEIDGDIIELNEESHFLLEQLHQKGEMNKLENPDAKPLPLDSSDKFLVAYKDNDTWKPNHIM